MKSQFYYLKSKVIDLRKSGKTYGEILKLVKVKIPKSTLSDWCSAISLTKKQKRRIEDTSIKNQKRGVALALIANKHKRAKYLKSIISRNKNLNFVLKNLETAKVALAMLYLGEGSKTIDRGLLTFGNSDPFIIDLFLNLIRKCYNINEKKFRCTVLCRADHDIAKLENFWQKITKISKSQFYKTRIDPRTIGKPSKKLNYKGVCKIDYFSADIFLDLMYIPKIVHKGP